MSDKLKNLRMAMDSTALKGKHFTERQKANIREAVHSDKNHKTYRHNKSVIVGLTAAVITIFALLISTELMIAPNNQHASNDISPVTANEWEIRKEYVENNKVLLSVYPEPYLTAGKPQGYIFSFKEPFETFEGKELAIYAYHKETGESFTAVLPRIIKEPSPGYDSLERFGTKFVVPKSGLWRFEVILDGEFYADVVLLVKE